MLTYVDESGREPALVVGGGVPKSWINKPMQVRGLPTSLGVIDWDWQPGKMRVRVHGSKPTVRVGPSFGATARIQVT